MVAEPYVVSNLLLVKFAAQRRQIAVFDIVGGFDQEKRQDDKVARRTARPKRGCGRYCFLLGGAGSTFYDQSVLVGGDDDEDNNQPGCAAMSDGK
jgi:hypothetical protein